jgi:hypothetical protein
MPSITHEVFTARVVDEIKFHILISEDTSRPDIAAIARSIQFCASGDIELGGDSSDDDTLMHSPDASFRYKGSGYPSVIIETSFSQKRNDLARIAQDYIVSSHGNIKLVVGLDIEYPQPKRATVSVWQCETGIGEDGAPYLRVAKVIDNEAMLLVTILTGLGIFTSDLVSSCSEMTIRPRYHKTLLFSSPCPLSCTQTLHCHQVW